MNNGPMTPGEWREARKRALVCALLYLAFFALGYWLTGRADGGFR